MHSIKTTCMTFIHLQLCAIALTATLPIPRPTVLLNGLECPKATIPQYSHTNLTNPFPIPLLVPSVNFSTVCRQFSGGFVLYNFQSIQLNLVDVLWVFQIAIQDSRAHPRGSLVGLSRVYEHDDVELLFYPEQVMTWRDLEGVSQILRGYVTRVTNFSILNEREKLIGKGEVGLV